jgi:hypothetical protein
LQLQGLRRHNRILTNSDFIAVFSFSSLVLLVLGDFASLQLEKPSLWLHFALMTIAAMVMIASAIVVPTIIATL